MDVSLGSHALSLPSTKCTTLTWVGQGTRFWSRETAAWRCAPFFAQMLSRATCGSYVAWALAGQLVVTSIIKWKRSFCETTDTLILLAAAFLLPVSPSSSLEDCVDGPA